ncbi:MAG: acyltransferase [Gammaproteobacteria bacterium]|nr:acyltransferase [Gammaproteobacteria bacterium]
METVIEKQHSGLKYRPDIDGLRAFAVLSVLIFHAFPERLRGGFVGVDVFFIISGYLISSILFSKLEADNFSLFDFYSKRIRRIFPALIIVLLSSLVFGYFLLFDGEYRLLGKHVTAGTGFISNFILWLESGYFDKAAELKPFLHLWSLGIEEQFYIFWPCLLFLTWWRSFNPWIFIGVLLTISFVSNVIAIQQHAVFTFYSPLTRAWELLLGALLAYQAHQKSPSTSNSSWINESKALVGLLLLLLSIFVLSKEYMYPGFWALLPTIGTILLISSTGSFINKKLLSHPLMVAIGLISYPLYLWHWPLLSYARIIFLEPSVTLIFSLLAISVILATLTYQWVEKPLRFSQHNPKKIIWGLCVALVIVGCWGLYIYRGKGEQSRKPQKFFLAQRSAVAEIEAFFNYEKSAIPCDVNTREISTSTKCFYTQKGVPTRAIWGDSHAEHLFPGLSETDKENNWLLVSHASCPPLSGIEIFQKGAKDRCSRNNDFALKTIIDTPSIETVVLSFFGSYYLVSEDNTDILFGERFLNNWVMRPKEGTADNLSNFVLFYQGIDRAITKLEQHGKHVILYKDIPEISFRPEMCIKRLFGPKENTCRMLLEEGLIKKQEIYAQLLHDLKKAHPNIKIFDSPSYLCDASSCNIRKNGKILYRDTHHLNLYGSKIFADLFIDWSSMEQNSIAHTTA